MRRNILVMAACSLLAACGKGGGTPAAPSPTPSTVQLTISPSTDLLKIKGAETFTATATLSDGTTRAVTPAWATDAAAVATVDAAGRVAGVGSGQATISATHESLRATRVIRVVPDYEGSWSGDYAVLSCQQSGDFALAGWCEEALTDGSANLTMTLTQTRDAVAGVWTHDRMSGATQGTIETAGALVLAGTGSYAGVSITIAGWRSLSTDNQNQTGRFTLTFTSPTWTGSVQSTVEIRTCTKGS